MSGASHGGPDRRISGASAARGFYVRSGPGLFRAGRPLRRSRASGQLLVLGLPSAAVLDGAGETGRGRDGEGLPQHPCAGIRVKVHDPSPTSTCVRYPAAFCRICRSIFSREQNRKVATSSSISMRLESLHGLEFDRRCGVLRGVEFLAPSQARPGALWVGIFCGSRPRVTDWSDLRAGPQSPDSCGSPLPRRLCGTRAPKRAAS